MSKPKISIFYQFYVGDYRRDTGRLSCEQHGAYRQLIDEYWVSGPLPDDDHLLARIVGLELRVWRKHRPVIMAFFKLRGGVWRHKRIDAELVKAGARKSKAKASAEARWGRPDAQGHARGMLGACSDDALHNHNHSSAYPSQEAGSDFQESSRATVVPLSGRASR